MKKFLLTLLFCIFANPIFAQIKPTTKTNLDITIDKKTTESSLTDIKNSFTEHIEKKLCNNTLTKDISSIKDKLFENAICDSKTIGETYNCICDKNDAKYKTFYKSVSAITDFSTLTGTTINQFQQIKNFYDALSSLPDIMTSVNSLVNEIARLKGQEAADKADREAKINTLKQKLIKDLKEKIEKEKELREKHPDIVDALKNTLKPHTDNDIKNYMNGKGTSDNAAQKYVDKVLNDLLKKNPDAKAEDLEKLYNQNEEKDNSETKITTHNIEAIDKAFKDEEKAEKDKELEKLLKLKKQEADLINELGKTKTPAVTVVPINDKDINGQNYNNPTKNTELNSALDKLITKKSPHPDNKAETIDEIKTDIENATHNINELKKLKEKLEQEKNELDKQLNDNYDKIKILLHKQNKEECKIFGQIDVIKGKVDNYNPLSISGAKIKCRNTEEEGFLNNAEKTLVEILKITSLTEKAKWNTCLKNKIGLLEKNLAGIEKNIPGTGPILIHINNIINKYPDVKELNCDFKCTNPETPNDEEGYDGWYNGAITLPTFQKKNGKTLEEQIEDCQLASKENAINNFTCPDNITVDIESIRKEMKKEINKNLDDILKIGEQKCKEAQIRAQEEAKKAKIASNLTNAIKELQAYCCNGTEFNEKNCSKEINLNRTTGNYRVKLTDFSSANNIIDTLREVANLKCPDDKDIINDIHNNTFTKTIYIGNTQSSSQNCVNNKRNIQENLNKRESNTTSKDYLGLTIKFCEWNN